MGVIAHDVLCNVPVNMEGIYGGKSYSCGAVSTAGIGKMANKRVDWPDRRTFKHGKRLHATLLADHIGVS